MRRTASRPCTCCNVSALLLHEPKFIVLSVNYRSKYITQLAATTEHDEWAIVDAIQTLSSGECGIRDEDRASMSAANAIWRLIEYAMNVQCWMCWCSNTVRFYWKGLHCEMVHNMHNNNNNTNNDDNNNFCIQDPNTRISVERRT